MCFCTVPQNVSADTIDEATEMSLKDAVGGVLPDVLGNLINRRKQVKDMLKKARDPNSKAQLDIEQKAIKITANSIYGCLGFVHSRFFAVHIASLVTYLGRKTLQHTKALAEKSGFNIIYGDTDSIMVATKSKFRADAIKVGEKLKMQVNKSFRHLYIEIDGLFSKLLLVKKKK